MPNLFFTKIFQFTLVIVLIVALNWISLLDKYSDDYTHESIVQASITYAIARGINGIVSVLQTSTIQGGVVIANGSITVGEMLDPINDLIERFSDVMVWALGSLLLQKVLLVISSNWVFKLLITISGIMLIAAQIMNNKSMAVTLMKVFLLLILIRFSLIIVVSLNSVVDNAFFVNQITDGTKELNQLGSDMAQLNNKNELSASDRKLYQDSIRDNRHKIDGIRNTTLPNLGQELADTMNELNDATTNFDDLKSRRSWTEKYVPFVDGEGIEEAEKRITIIEDKIDSLKGNIQEQEMLIKRLSEEIEVSERRLAGEPVGLWENIIDWTPSLSGVKRSLSPNEIGENITNSASNVIQLSVLFILKTILMPIAFMLIFIRVFKSIWNAEDTYIQTREK